MQADRLIAKVRQAVGDPDLDVVVTAFEQEERIEISARGRNFSFDDREFDKHLFWSVVFANMAHTVAEGLRETGNG
jgi:hypothetical protein